MADAEHPREQEGTPSAADELRRQAEERMDRFADEFLDSAVGASERASLAEVVHELRVHQIELSMQNEELRTAELKLEEQRRKYFDLFDVAPVGYVTLSDEGMVAVANLTAAHLLGVERQLLVGKPFSGFVVTEDRDAYYLHHRMLEQTGEPQAVEVRLWRSGDGAGPGRFWAHLASRPQLDAEGDPVSSWVTFTDVSDRHAAEDSMREREERHRAVLETAMDGFWMADTQGRLLEANETYCRMSGYSAQELLGMTIVQLQAGETDAQVAARIQAIIVSGEDRFETLLRRKDGSVFDGEVSVQYWPGEGGRFVSFLRDISERKRAERYAEIAREVLHILNQPGDLNASIRRVLALIRMKTGFDVVGLRLQQGEDFPYFAQEGLSSEFLATENTLLERDGDGAVCRDDDGNAVLECTCGLVISDGTDPTDPLFTPGGSFWTNDSMPLLDLPGDQDPRHHPRNQCMLHGLASMALVPMRERDRVVGLIHLADRRAGLLTLEVVELLEGIAAHIGDAMVRKQAEEARRESEARLREVLENSLDASYKRDLKTDTYEYLSPAFALMLGYSHDEFEALPLETVADMMHPDDRAEIDRTMARATSDPAGITYGFDYRFRHKDGGYRWLHDGFRVMRDEEGRPVALVGSVSDITERKQVEEALREMNESLEERVGERTAELSVRAEELERALRVKDVFLASMSHELRTPLNSIIGFSWILESDGAGELPAEARKQAGFIHASGKQLLAVIDTLLDSASIAAGLLKPRVAPFTLDELLETIESTMGPLVRTAGLEFTVSAPTEPTTLVSDEGRIREVLFNLIGNALKFTEEGSITLDVALADGYVRFAVADTGLGIAAEDLDQIMEPFLQLPQSGTSKTQGAGLGLAICAQIAEALGGGITVESRLGVGSTFALTLRQTLEDSGT